MQAHSNLTASLGGGKLGILLIVKVSRDSHAKDSWLFCIFAYRTNHLLFFVEIGRGRGGELGKHVLLLNQKGKFLKKIFVSQQLMMFGRE